MILNGSLLRGTVASLAAWVLLAPQGAVAQRSFNPQLFHPAPGPDAFVTVESAVPLAHKAYSLGLTLNWARDPFALLGYDQQKGTTTGARAVLLQNVLGGELWGAFGLFDRFQLALSVPVTLFQNGQRFDDDNPPPGGTHLKPPSALAMGDPRLYLKARLYGHEEGLQLGLSHWLSVPIGSDQRFGGEKHFSGFAGEGRVLVGWEGRRWRLGAFVGFHWRAHVSRFLSTIVGNQLTYGGAAAVGPFWRRLTVVAELYGHSNSIDSITVKDGSKNSITDLNDNPLELDLSAKIMVRYGLSLHVGVGNGLIAGLGAPQPRVFLGAVWSPGFADRDRDGVPDAFDACPTEPEDRDGFQDQDGCPDPDNDNDAILDVDDKCPNQAEDFDHFEDEDGCPEPDNDHDGIDDLHDACPNDPEDHKGPRPNDGCPIGKADTDGDGVDDAHDKCPKEPEDRDGFQDEDGCPDPDNDGDGIPDNFDQCPLAAEDFDNFQDDDGCPDPDNDQDGVPDSEDKCPNEPETLNGVKDEDGCPEAAPPPNVTLDASQQQIVIVGKVLFAGAKLKPASLPLLKQVAQLLRGHRELKIEIQGHTDDQGDLDRNVALSKQQAEAVRAYLIEAGVEATRLVSAGYGPTRPVADNHTRAGREANRRIEFHLMAAPPGPAADEGDSQNDGSKEQ